MRDEDVAGLRDTAPLAMNEGFALSFSYHSETQTIGIFHLKMKMYLKHVSF